MDVHGVFIVEWLVMGDCKVLIISQLYSPESGGNASRISDMAEHLKLMGTDVTVISPHPTLPFGQFKRVWKTSVSKNINGVNVINLWTWQPSSGNPSFISRIAYYLLFAFHATLWVLLNSKKFDFIITSSPPIFINIPGLICRYVFKKPWGVDIRDIWIDASVNMGFIKAGGLFERVSRGLEKRYYKNSDLIFTTTHEIKKKILVRYGSLDEQKIVVIQNGVDTKKFQPCAKEKKVQIIYTGNIGHAQDLENVVLAMKIVKTKSDVKLLIVGDGDLKERLIKLAEENGLTDVIIFKEPVPRGEVPLIISESLIGIAPVKNLECHECVVPTKVYEYMSCGVPFIGCGGREIENIARMSGGGLYTKNDKEAIAAAILQLLGDSEQLNKRGIDGCEYVRKSCDRKMIAQSLKIQILQVTSKTN